MKWGLILKLLMRAFAWRPWIPGMLKLDSILSQFKCGSITTTKTPLCLLSSKANKVQYRDETVNKSLVVLLNDVQFV